ncbi:MAG: RdgB/HAM1 family non-canonical purine NTP pyrophosphatase [Pseudomonadota bacterium]
MRHFDHHQLLLASHNQGKLHEFRHALTDLNVDIVSASEHNLPEPEETGDSFFANAQLKAKAAMDQTGLPALADDSGLSVEGLDGAPGIFSARWAGPNKDFTVAFDRIAHDLSAKDIPPEGAKAAFICVLVLTWPDGEEMSAEGRVLGNLTFPPRGQGGFGYDPIFIPQGEERSFAEMAREEKAKYSHRHRALEALRPLMIKKSHHS